MKRLIIAATLALSVGTAHADGMVTYETQDSFEDVVFGLENAILDLGLVVDHVSHTGEMLERTKADVGGTVTLFTQADVYSFCSAALSRKVMEADPMNIAHCPYGIFITEAEGEVMVGYRNMPEGPMQEVQALLEEIAQEAIGN